MNLLNRIEEMSYEAIIGADIDMMEALSLIEEANEQGIDTKDFEDLLLGEEGLTDTDMDQLIDSIECAGYRVNKIIGDDSIELVISEQPFGIILH